MSAHAPIEITFAQALHEAIADVNRWRGHCLELHARLERGVNAALTHWKPGTTLPQKVSERLKALQQLTAPEGAHSGAKLYDLFAQLQEQRSGWRDRLAHATSTVHLDEDRNWIWHFSMPRPGNKPDVTGAISFAAARDIEDQLGRSVNALRSKLKKLNVPACL